ncbi:probable pyridoxal 5'-phosphate synthase subunit Sno3p [[Candida] jaroonii]|uniref:Probable pyridoxal 5'-phosphate synthase subunit Sno3p n=1 Tax=[Candida] jaroonii TaxID=467808 RepID=A0ACA9Y174_9ASCO|nr:probable pyridoxal 5'-phosphate synthase subunit Sno3p [[Candida] jaroonii]
MTIEKTLVVGVLALQGAFIEHINHFKQCQVESYAFSFVEVRTEEELNKCHALVIPGGESTAISLISQRTGLLKPLMDFVKSNKPIWGTCAGLIFLSKQIINGKPGQQILGGMDIQVERNAFGRQLDSFQQNLDFSSFIPELTDFPTVFIRAPVISKILNDEQQSDDADVIYSKNDYVNDRPVEVLHKLDNGFIVAVRQGNKLGTSFHPELSENHKFHQWFLQDFVVNSI